MIWLYFGINSIDCEALKDKLHKYLMEEVYSQVSHRHFIGILIGVFIGILTLGSSMKSRVLFVLSMKFRVILRIKGIYSILRLVMSDISPKADCPLPCLQSLPEQHSQVEKDLDYNIALKKKKNIRKAITQYQGKEIMTTTMDSGGFRRRFLWDYGMCLEIRIF